MSQLLNNQLSNMIILHYDDNNFHSPVAETNRSNMFYYYFIIVLCCLVSFNDIFPVCVKPEPQRFNYNILSMGFVHFSVNSSVSNKKDDRNTVDFIRFGYVYI